MATVISIAPYKFLPARFGGQKHIDLFYKYLSRYQKLVCLSVDNNENREAEGYEAIHFFSSSRFRYIDPTNFFRLRKMIRERNATHLMTEHPYFGWLVLLLKWTTKVKLVIHSHNIEGLRFKSLDKWWWKAMWYYEKIVHRHADYNLFITAEDLNYAVAHYGLNPKKCMVATYGIERMAPPSPAEKNQAKRQICKQYHISEEERILLFVGAFNYQPNKAAFAILQEEIAPRLKKQLFPFKIIICGPHLSPEASSDPNIIITGFVDDIASYFMGADVFINPIAEGGGIKTKLVEALGYDLNVVSTESGAFGVAPGYCAQKLHIVADNDWDALASTIITMDKKDDAIPEAFFRHFSWDHIAERTARFISAPE